MSKISQIILALAVAIVTAAVTWYATKKLDPTIEYIDDPGTQQIDSTAYVRRSRYITLQSIRDSLKSKNEALAQRIRNTEVENITLTNINAQLRTKTDSLEANNDAVYIPDLEIDSADWAASIADTTLHFIRFHGQRLFRTDNFVRIRKDSIRFHNQLEQIRPVELSVVTTISDDQSQVITYVDSKDFVSVEYQSSTTIQEQNRFPWKWVFLGGGIITGVLIE
ncbi:MAG: hypothetical protein ACQETE_01520 [Bacteroidota bacterium]